MEPWKIMLGLAGALVLFGAAVSLGVSTPGQAVLYLFGIGFFIVTMYIGFKLGNLIGEARRE